MWTPVAAGAAWLCAGSACRLQQHTGVRLHSATASAGRGHVPPREHLQWERDLLGLCSRFFSSHLFFFNIIKAHPYFSSLGFGVFPTFHKLRQQ